MRQTLHLEYLDGVGSRPDPLDELRQWHRDAVMLMNDLQNGAIYLPYERLAGAARAADPAGVADELRDHVARAILLLGGASAELSVACETATREATATRRASAAAVVGTTGGAR